MWIPGEKTSVDRHPAGIECCGPWLDHGSEQPAARHVKAPRSPAMLLHRGFEGPCPCAVPVDGRGLPGPEERERQVAVSTFRTLRDYAVDLESSLDHRRVGKWRNAVDRQDPGEPASLTVQPHRGQSPPGDVGFGQNLCPPDAQLCGRRAGRGRTWSRWHGRSVAPDGDSGSDFPLGTWTPADLWKDSRRRTTRMTSPDDEKAPPVGDRAAFTRASEGRLVTYAHVWCPRLSRAPRGM